MNKVWSVEYGDYSGGHVYGIFSTKEKAEKYLADMREAEIKRMIDANANPYRIRKIPQKELDQQIAKIRAGTADYDHDFVSEYDLDPDYNTEHGL